jgi:RND family efflux transporter MFP subunit
MGGKLLLFALLMWPAHASLAEDVRIDNVGVTLIDKADVPVLEAGALRELSVQEGDRVSAGQRLARIDDDDAQLQLARARIAAEEAQHLAENDVPLRLAQKALELAQLDLQRALESIERFPKSVSASQLDRLKLTVEKAQLEIELARREQTSAANKAKAAQNEVALAQALLDRRSVASPLEGVVSEVKRRPGEWLTPGELLIRVVNVDRLRAEGFVTPEQLSSTLNGRKARLQVTFPGDRVEEFPGRVTFVSSEANPVNGSVRITAEIENRDLLLRPGQSGTLILDAAESAP